MTFQGIGPTYCNGECLILHLGYSNIVIGQAALFLDSDKLWQLQLWMLFKLRQLQLQFTWSNTFMLFKLRQLELLERAIVRLHSPAEGVTRTWTSYTAWPAVLVATHVQVPVSDNWVSLMQTLPSIPSTTQAPPLGDSQLLTNLSCHRYND